MLIRPPPHISIATVWFYALGSLSADQPSILDFHVLEDKIAALVPDSRLLLELVDVKGFPVPLVGPVFDAFCPADRLNLVNLVNLLAPREVGGRRQQG